MQRLMLAYAATGLGSGFVRVLGAEDISALAGFLAVQGLRLIRVGASRMLRSLFFALVWSYVTGLAPHALAAHLKSPAAAIAAVVVAQIAP